MPSPTELTLRELRKRGFDADVAERFNAFSQQRIDLFGGIDIVAIDDEVTIGIQATTVKNQAARMTKLQGIPEILRFARGPNRRVEVWGWKKRKIDGTKIEKWEPTIRVL